MNDLRNVDYGNVPADYREGLIDIYNGEEQW
jgi:hypothetical protein